MNKLQQFGGDLMLLSSISGCFCSGFVFFLAGHEELRTFFLFSAVSFYLVALYGFFLTTRKNEGKF